MSDGCSTVLDIDTREFAGGWRAYQEGARDVSDCPYAAGEARRLWMLGFHEAFEADRCNEDYV